MHASYEAQLLATISSLRAELDSMRAADEEREHWVSLSKALRPQQHTCSLTLQLAEFSHDPFERIYFAPGRYAR